MANEVLLMVESVEKSVTSLTGNPFGLSTNQRDIKPRINEITAKILANRLLLNTRKIT